MGVSPFCQIGYEQDKKRFLKQSNTNHAMLIFILTTWHGTNLMEYYDDAVGVPSNCFIYDY